MKDWFTVEQIDADTYAISEYAHWEEPHSYLLCGAERALLIDTGLGVSNLYQVIRGITTLPITVATTHIHWDHIGGHRDFHDLLVHEAEAEWLNGQFPLPLSVVRANLTRVPCVFPDDFDVEQYRVFQGAPGGILRDGDVIRLGNREVRVIHTPGHSPGHCCFYEEDRAYLYAGDLLYSGCLDAFYPTTDPKQFRESVHKVCALDVKRIMPGHHRLSVPVDLIERVAAAFDGLADEGKLEQGSGLFVFDDFQIHI